MTACVAAALFAAVSFTRAEPVWVKGEADSLNSFFEFRTDFHAEAGDVAVLRVTAGYDYRAELNGRFAAFGPARCAPGFFRVDEWRLETRPGDNSLSLFSAGYNCNSFYLPKQKPFLSAEVLVNGTVVAATCADGTSAPAAPFTAYGTGRVRKVPRFSYQRTFSEVYRLPYAAPGPLPLEGQPAKRCLPREWDRPTFERVALKPLSIEKTRYVADAPVTTPRFIDGGPQNFIRFPVGELAENPCYDMQRTRTVSRRRADGALRGGLTLHDGEGVVFAADRVYGGFVGFQIHVTAPVTVYLVFDEILQDDGSVDFMRTDTVATLVWHFDAAGDWQVESFEPYGLKYLRVLAAGGEATVASSWIRTYESPSAERAKFRSSDADLVKIFEAAKASYKANSVDCFSDCPNRERAGWLGDTFFTGRASQWLSGSGRNERLFLENFLLPEKFGSAKRYDGLVPAVWPADLMCRECFIPTYAMWMVMEMCEYVRRNGDAGFAEKCRPRILETLAWLEKHINDDGVLQHLPGWVFIDWSRANLLSYDVNWPANMLYAAMLEAVADVYGVAGCADRARAVRERIRGMSWTGEWFCDNSVVVDECGSLGLSGERTEACQYYAVFTGAADRSLHPRLFDRLVSEFGPARVDSGRHAEICPANLLFGTCLRMELLSREARGRQMLSEMKGCFLGMAERTGTLWENRQPSASCCHGFSSVAAEYIYRDILGLRKVDRRSKSIVFAPPDDIGIEWCEADVPLSETEVATFGWRRVNGRLRTSASLPPGWVERGVWPTTCFEMEPWWAVKGYWQRRMTEQNERIARSDGAFDVVFIGDSITHNWEGWQDAESKELVERLYREGRLKTVNAPGAGALRKLESRYSILNLGMGGDRTTDVLWRLTEGRQLEGYRAKLFMLMIGTNDECDDPVRIADGVRAILDAVALRQPQSRTLLLPIFPCQARRDDPRRRLHAAVNSIIKGFADGDKVIWCDFNDRFLDPDGGLSPSMFPDLLHPAERGYEIWADAVEPFFRRICGDDAPRRRRPSP